MLMYKVPATSAFVLLFADSSTYDGTASKRLLASIDLSEGRALKDRFDDIDLTPTQELKDIGLDPWELATAEIGSRKVRVKKLSHQFMRVNPTAQVVSLGGGLDPLSLDLAELYPAAAVFDVDMSQMDVKAAINAAVDGPEMKFVTANLADVETITGALQAHGWNPDRPTLVLAEGITYYVPAPVFARTLEAVRTNGGGLVLEYSLPDDEIPDVDFVEGYQAFFKALGEMVELPFPMVRYSKAYVKALAQQLGGTVVQTLYGHDAERELKGRNEFFMEPKSGTIRVSLIEF